jgi:hypothetical protein
VSHAGLTLDSCNGACDRNGVAEKGKDRECRDLVFCRAKRLTTARREEFIEIEWALL